MLPDNKANRSWQDIAEEIVSKNRSSEIASLVEELLHRLDEARGPSVIGKSCDQHSAS